jgi:hypothetical protein
VSFFLEPVELLRCPHGSQLERWTEVPMPLETPLEPTLTVVEGQPLRQHRKDNVATRLRGAFMAGPATVEVPSLLCRLR